MSQFVNWKTTIQLTLLGAQILGMSMPGWTVSVAGLTMNVPPTLGLTTLWAAAALTVLTGWD